MEQSQDRISFGEAIKRSWEGLVRDPDTGEMVTRGALLAERHRQIEDLVKRAFKRAEKT